MEPLHQPNNIIAQKYKIISTLGEGGSGITYLAQDLQNNQNVALKALSLHRMTDWKAMELFEREAKILAQLNHPAIPDYLEYFDAEIDGEKYFYIAQQLAPGKSLAKLVEENFRTNEQQIKDIAKQILEILIYLHSQTPAVVHRDIKPQNIIYDKDGKVFLVDFGAVQDTYYSTFMRGSTVVGTYGYMSPEQFRGQSVPATDLYGLGATLLFLLTHRSPADFPTDGLKIDFRSRVKVSDDFADWLDKMLEPDLEDRFSSAREALEVLQGKRKVITATKKPMLWKAVVGMGFSVLVTVGVFHHYKWAILNRLAFVPTESICDNVNDIKNYVTYGGNPSLNLKSSDSSKRKKTLLRCAIEANSQPLAEFLIAKGANINEELHYVKSVDWAKFLIDKGADVNRKINYAQTPLHYAVINQRKDIVELLLSHQAGVNAEDKFGYTPLLLLFEIHRKNSNDLNIQLLNDYRVDVRYINAKSKRLRLPLMKLLVEKGANINIQNYQGYAPLHLAVKQNDREIVKYLIRKKAKVDIRTKNNAETPLMLAAKETAEIPIVKILTDNGADVNAKESDGNTPLHIASMNTQKSKDIIRLLVKSGANINAKANNGKTPLHNAIKVGKNRVKVLVDLGANVNAKDYKGETPIHTAIRHWINNRNEQDSIMNSIRYLVKSGANINAKNNNGLTLLHIVAKEGHLKDLDIVEFVSQLGASFGVKNN
ncbi:serine/threonine protein kinase [Calothrix parasitica NIES-267]|uniref:Serine/threonine protein kinase n=1 Tax=Calothrix parasitica NIES-267 TaxID=1973488 RepID=A0A1Z4LZ91_9CYAN|nr:serine/threonine protein kinase [Calothrix parasitica NIES-267]